ncbi:MAG: hypothetical protein KF787_07515 [Phycisphaeraceae bacterium]|nr:hypothetical protein [Phycisphaerae bacterium]MBX3392480.1 hypothetical protein [Phycisphaeraceae bacterium]
MIRPAMFPIVMTLLTVTLAAPLAVAQHAGDIFLQLNYLGRICTARIDPDGGGIFNNARVFSAEFGESPNFTNDPGMDSDPGTFAVGTAIGFNIRRALRKWDGTDFSQIPEERIRVRLAILGPVFSPETDEVVPGFAMPVNTQGEFHHHPGFTLLEPASDGVYLLELELWSTQEGILPSRPYWMVFNQNESEAVHAEAIQWVIDNAVGCVSDFDASGFVDTDDFDDFVRAFEAGDFTADVDGTGFVDTDDFDFFVHAFESGC